MVSNLLKRWWDDFATVKRQRDGFRAFRKETGCYPASSRPISSTVYMCYPNKQVPRRPLMRESRWSKVGFNCVTVSLFGYTGDNLSALYTYFA
jgi:hypothetical protein